MRVPPRVDERRGAVGAALIREELYTDRDLGLV
jgi:hypothetical protein